MCRSRSVVFLLWVVVLASARGVAAVLPERGLLFDAAAEQPLALWSANDAAVGPVDRDPIRGLRVVTGTRERWPGLTLRAPAEGWDLTPFAEVVVQLHNAGTNAVKVFGRLDNPGADGTRHCVTAETTLGAGASGTLRIPIHRSSGGTLGGKLFGLRGYPAVAGGDRTVDPARINQLLLFVSEPRSPYTFVVREVRATGTYVRPTAWVDDADPYVPLIDRFGQYRHRDWPGKVRDVEDLRGRRESEAKELAARPDPEGWDRYGGWSKGPRLEATGFFRVQKHAGRWWLVDPDGFLFWSHGVDCVGALDTTAVAERETWFEGLGEGGPDLQAFFVKSARALKGHYAGRSPRCFSFAGANLRLKYGPEWRSVLPDVIHRRLRAWGMNTIANWSDYRVARLRRTAYTDTIHSEQGRMIEGSEGYWGKFPDVFDPEFAAGLRREMESKRGQSAGDPWCLGYFSDNEMSWGDEVSLAVAALRSPPDQPAKRAFLDDLRRKYGGIEQLNAAWGSAHVSWEALAEVRTAPERARAEADLTTFYSRVADTYFRTVRETIRAVAPQQLYLGCRFAWVNARAAAAAARSCDVVSYNLYQRSVAEFVFNGGADVPLIIGEFHFGALDRGLFHTGLVPVSDQAARAQAYQDYVEGALRHPQFVGTHWFQWQDEPTTGRVWDEENYQIGLVDVADTPYAETVAAVRSVGNRLYRLRLESR